MDIENIGSHLRNILLFSSLTNDELRQIGDKIAVKRFRKNDVIMYAEDTNEFMYVILAGKVKVIQTTEDGKEMILAIHREGDFFGEVSLIDNKTTPAMVLALEDSIIALVSKLDFSSLLYSQGKVLDVLLKILCSRLRESWSKIQMLTFTNASQKIKMLFLLLSEEHGIKTGEGVILDIKLTHQDIANMIGISRETVTRIIDKWHKDGEIKMVGNKVRLLSHNFLQRI
ncbi:MAG: Crp/Fnr family transcriptional regulator [Nitrospiraceae bacterium]|nr:Crp/Fnr family transcriptional regulator [Nitrospiraceae bacterium]MDA8424024.1 Crp/Fnr family transcriptional regulator [Nitrospiraceae bacterium]